MPRKKKTTNTEAVTMAADTMALQAPVMALADTQALAVAEHTSKKLITDQEAMERLGQAVDIAVQRAEDAIPAAGINLLRGTRDFVQGRDLVLSGSNRYYDGCYLPSYVSLEKEDSGFTVATLSQSGLSADNVIQFYSSDVKVNIGDEFTVSLYIYVSSDAIGDSVALSTYGENSTNLIESYSVVNASRFTEKDKWVKVSATYKISDEKSKHMIIRFRLQRNGTVKFKMAKVQRLRAENPTWSASPFDVSQIDGYKQYNASSFITPKEGFTVEAAGLHVLNERIAQLYVKLITSKEISSGGTFTPFTIDSKIRPIIYTPICGNGYLSGWVNTGNLAVEVKAVNAISANSAVYIASSAFVLNNKFVQE